MLGALPVSAQNEVPLAAASPGRLEVAGVEIAGLGAFPDLMERLGCERTGQPAEGQILPHVGEDALCREPRRLPLHPGVEYSIERLQLTEREISRGLAERGHPFSLIEFAGELRGDPPVAEVRLVVTPGRSAIFGLARIDAESPVREAEARRWLPFRPGDPFDVHELEHAAERLLAIPVVEQVTVRVTPDPQSDSLVATTFLLGTGRVQGVGLEGAFSSQQCLEGRLSLWNRHLFGGPRTLLLGVGGANLLTRQLRRFPCTGVGEAEFEDPDYLVQAELREPVRPGTWLTLGAEVSRLSAQQAYIRRGFQLRLGLTRELQRGLSAGLNVAPERRDNPVGAPVLCGVYGICDGEPLQNLLRARTHLPLEATLAWLPPRFDGVATPAPDAPLWLVPFARPWRASLRGSLVASPGEPFSEVSYGGGVIEASAARILSPRVELATRTRLGWVFDGGRPVPPQVRFYGGGILGVRGVQPNRLGPKILTIATDSVPLLGCPVAPGACEGIVVTEDLVRVRPTGGNALVEVSAESRVWATRWLQVALFTDLGYLRSGAAPGAPLIDRSEAVITPGLGVMIVSPFGPIRVDVAYNPTPTRTFPLLTRHTAEAEQMFLGNVVFDPFTFDSPTARREFRRRLQFQLSMAPPSEERPLGNCCSTSGYYPGLRGLPASVRGRGRKILSN
jgi:hypothetical protein